MYLTFERFTNTELAKAFGETLTSLEIPFIIEDNSANLGPSFRFDAFDNHVSIKIKQEDFVRANNALETYYVTTLDSIEKNYYLFEFSNEELMEIVTKPDEWGRIDYLLAKKILNQRGVALNPEMALLLKTQRQADLSRPESASKYWVYFGYTSAIFGGLFGIFIGWNLAHSKKTLPDGSRIFSYSEQNRNHGKNILLIGSLAFVLVAILRIYLTIT